MTAALDRPEVDVGAGRRDLILGLGHSLRPVTQVVAHLIRREVAAAHPATGFESDHIQPGVDERQYGHSAHGTEADHYHVCSGEFSGHGLHLLSAMLNQPGPSCESACRRLTGDSVPDRAPGGSLPASRWL